MRALELCARSASGELERCNLGPDLAVVLRRGLDRRTPVAYVIAEQDLPALKALSGLVVDLHDQSKGSPLQVRLLRQSMIPLIRSKYSGSTTLGNALRKLLSNAKTIGDENVYVIGVNESLFSELWSGAAAVGTNAGVVRALTDPGATPPAVPWGSSPHLCNRNRSLPNFFPVPKEVTDTFVGVSLDVQIVWQLIVRAAATDLPVLILGECGTGKELIAGLIHKLSGRPGRFVPVNCGAIPDDLIASELFGSVAGAFTNATDRIGRWRAADGGTLFLDEVGDLTLRHQASVLRAISTHAIQPVGSDRDIPVKVRLIAATNRDLSEDRFRSDLYYRVAALIIETPRLADHREDIPVLANHFWRLITRRHDIELSKEVLGKLGSYDWPGNSRQLQHFLEEMYVIYQRPEGLTVDQVVLPTDDRSPSRTERDSKPLDPNTYYHGFIHDIERIGYALHTCKVSGRPIAKPNPVFEAFAQVQSALIRNATQLETLCDHVIPYCSWEVHDQVARFKDLLTVCSAALVTNPERAVRMWHAEIEPAYRIASDALFASRLQIEAAWRAFQTGAASRTDQPVEAVKSAENNRVGAPQPPAEPAAMQSHARSEVARPRMPRRPSSHRRRTLRRLPIVSLKLRRRDLEF